MTTLQTLLAACLTTSAPHAPANSSSPVLVAYSELGSAIPVYSTWDDLSWTAPSNLPTPGREGRWVLLEQCPTRNEIAFAALDYDSDVNVALFNGTSWGAVTEVCTSTGGNDDRCLDIAYESQSGDLLIVYWNSTSSLVGFRTCSGGAVSGESTLALPAAVRCRFLALYPSPTTDEVFLLALNNDSDLFAYTWSGSAFGAVTTFETSTPTNSDESFAIAFETVSGDALAVYGESGAATPRYRVYSAGAWSAEASLPSTGGAPKWVRLSSHPTTDAILFAGLDNSNDLNANLWSGSAWGTNAQLETNVGFSDRRGFDIAYEATGAEAIVVYAESGTNRPQYRRWNGSSWTAEADGPDIGEVPQFIEVAAGAGASEIYVLCSDAGLDLCMMQWTGSAMTGHVEMDNALGSTAATQQFALVLPTWPTLHPPRLGQWQQTDPN